MLTTRGIQPSGRPPWGQFSRTRFPEPSTQYRVPSTQYVFTPSTLRLTPFPPYVCPATSAMVADEFLKNYGGRVSVPVRIKRCRVVGTVWVVRAPITNTVQGAGQ